MIKLTCECDRTDLDLVPVLVPSLAPQVKLVSGNLKRASITGDVVITHEGQEGEATISLTVNDA